MLYIYIVILGNQDCLAIGQTNLFNWNGRIFHESLLLAITVSGMLYAPLFPIMENLPVYGFVASAFIARPSTICAAHNICRCQRTFIIYTRF